MRPNFGEVRVRLIFRRCNHRIPDVITRSDSFNDFAARLARAAVCLGKTGWPTRAADIAVAVPIFQDWLAKTHGSWQSCGERDRFPLIAALSEAFESHHDKTTVEHLCVVFAAAFEARARKMGANRQGTQQ